MAGQPSGHVSVLNSVFGALEMCLYPGKMFFFGERAALDGISVCAEGQIDLPVNVQDAENANAGGFLARPAIQFYPLVERQAIEPITHGGPFLAEQIGILLPEGLDLAFGPQ